jgi:hypothetical protein
MSKKPDEIKPKLQQALYDLAVHAEHLIKTERERDWLPLMRNQAYDLGIHEDVKDAELKAYLERAERSQRKGRVYKGGETLLEEEPSFMLDGLIHLAQANFLIGQPKIGKSSFACGLVAAIRDRREQFLGRDLKLSETRMPVLIFGTDQSEGNWQYYLRREGLINDAKQLDSNAIDLFCSVDTKDEFNFTKDGIRHMREEIERYQFPLVIIDSLSSMMEPCGIEENLSRFAEPIRTAMADLSQTGATILVLHHTKKYPTTWDWVAECRGSSSITSIPSWGVLMRWVRDESEGLARIDKRVGFVGSGRGYSELGGVEAEYLSEGNWTLKGSLEHSQQVELVRKKIASLGGVRGDVFDYLKMRSELGADVPADEIAHNMTPAKSTGHIGRELGNLVGMGLAFVSRSEPTGRRPKRYWKVSEFALAAEDDPADLLREPQDGSKGSFGSNAIRSKRSIKTHLQGGEEEGDPLLKDPIAPGSPVEVNRDGIWSGGYVVRDGSNPDSITLERLGNPMITLSNQRLGIDVRPCESPFSFAEPQVDW